MLHPQENRNIISGEIADYWLSPEGILYSYSKSIERTVENIVNNTVLIKKITSDRKVPLLIFLTPTPVPDKATRKFATTVLPKIYSAMAMVAPSALTRMVMNLVFGLKKPPIPTRSFTNEAEAHAWLKQYV